MIQNKNFDEEIKKLSGFKRRRGNKNLSTSNYRSYDEKLSNIRERLYTAPKKASFIQEINECIEYHATDEDFKNPIQYIDDLWRENNSTGIIKIHPPSSWLNYNNKVFNEFYLPKFEKSDIKLETRIQTLNNLFYGKKFEYVKEFNYAEYIKKAHEIEKNFYPSNKQIKILETDFWKFCTDKTNDIKTHYAADIPYKKFFNKGYISSIKQKFNNKEWSLLNISHKKNSLFQFLENETTSNICGLTIPWLYFGMLYSTFCWHVEDLNLFSINYMHHGSAKIWYAIPEEDKEKMDAFIIKKYKNYVKQDPGFMHRLVLLIDPNELIKNGIKVYKTIQNPGELIITFPKAYHSGFSTGFNIAEAVNFATSDWIRYGKNAVLSYQKSLNKSPAFSLDWLIYKNLKNLNKSIFDNDQSIKQIINYMEDVLRKEIDLRKRFENYLKEKNLNFHIFNIKDNDSYDKYECEYCVNYGFFSIVSCIFCNFKNCLNHLKICKCNNDIQLYYRDLNILTDIN